MNPKELQELLPFTFLEIRYTALQRNMFQSYLNWATLDEKLVFIFVFFYFCGNLQRLSRWKGKGFLSKKHAITNSRTSGNAHKWKQAKSVGLGIISKCSRLILQACVIQTKGGIPVISQHDVTPTKRCSVSFQIFYSILCFQNTLLRQPLANGSLWWNLSTSYSFLEKYRKSVDELWSIFPPPVSLTLSHDIEAPEMWCCMNPIHSQSRRRFFRIPSFLAGFVCLFVNLITAW